MSLRLRITLWIAAINTVIVLATGSAFWLYGRWQLDRTLNARRIQRLERLAAELHPVPTTELPGYVAGLYSRIADQYMGEQVRIALSDQKGVIAVAPEDLPELLSIPVASVAETGRPRVDKIRLVFQEDPEPGRVVTVPLETSDHRTIALSLVATDRFAQRQMARAGEAMIALLLVGPLAAAASAWFIARIAVVPLERLRQLASQIPASPGDSALTDSFPKSPLEVQKLVAELDLALSRVRSRHASQDRFIYNVSHELKTPIAVVLAEAQTIDRAGVPAAAAEFIGSVQEEMFRLGRIIEGLLALSRVNNGEGLRRARACAVNDLVMDSLEDCRSLAERKGVRLVPSLAQADEHDDAIIGDPDLLRIMLERLIRDAVRHSTSGMTVNVSAARSNGTAPPAAQITIDDAGPEVPSEHVAANLDLTTRGSGQPEHERGGGLSLTIAAAIAELHRGTVEVSSRNGSGCSVRVTLPLQRHTAPAPRAPIAAPPAAGAASSIQNEP